MKINYVLVDHENVGLDSVDLLKNQSFRLLVFVGALQNRISSAAASTVTDFLSADMNGDGKLDIVSADGGNSTVSISLGNGDGTFQARVSYSTTLSAGGLSVGYFDGNGTIDVAAGIG